MIMRRIRRRLFYTYANLDLPIQWQDDVIAEWAKGKSIGTRRDCMAVTSFLRSELKGKSLETFPEFRWFTEIKSWDVAIFEYCVKLKDVSLPDTMPKITDWAFNGCTSLALTSLPEGITSIGARAFSGCTSLALTSLPEGITSIGDYAFDGCTSLALTSLPEGITSIGNWAFRGCTSLALTSLPEGITSIEDSAFRYCPNMRVTVIPDSVTSIGKWALADWEYPTRMTIPTSLASIGDWGLRFNKGLKYIRLKATTPPTLENAIYLGDSTQIYVPNESVDAYKAADVWSAIASRIHPVSEWAEE